MKIPKLVLAILAVGLVGSGLTAPKAQADMINGDITFSGGAIFDTNSLATATRVNTFKNVVVASVDGDFATTVNVGDSVTMAQPYIFNPSTPTPALWSVGGFTFDLTSSTVVLQNSEFLNITGTGILSGNGYDPTVGSWTFSSQSPSANGVFSFSSGSSASGAQGVPDGGTTVALLGIALAGVEVIRRKLAAA